MRLYIFMAIENLKSQLGTCTLDSLTFRSMLVENYQTETKNCYIFNFNVCTVKKSS
jgi:hypothetical protein